MAYDQLGMSVGGFLQDLGTSMYRDKRAKAAYAEEMKAREAEDQRKYEMQLKQIEAAELSKAEREAAREQARAEREAERDRRQFEQQRMMEEMRSASREKAAGIRANRPAAARDHSPSYDKIRNDITGEETYIERGGKMPEGFRFYQPRGDARRGGKPTPAKDYIGAAAGAASKLASTFASGTRAPLMASEPPRSSAPSAGRPVMAVDGPAKPSAPSGGPKPGEVMDGFQFMGGDPADPASWRKL